MQQASFAFDGWRGEVAPGLELVDLEREVRRLVDPGRARATLHWQRNYIYAVELETAAGRVPAAVKQFRNQGRAARRRAHRGSKAEKSWRVARAMVEAEVSTPEPLLLVESTEPEGSSYFVSRQLEDCWEMRYLFRALAAARHAPAPGAALAFEALDKASDEMRPREVVLEPLFAALGESLRRLHDAGIWHRDVSMGNLLVAGPAAPGEPPAIYLIDLNRARLGRRMGVVRRTRDLCRLPVLDAGLRRTFLSAYWAGRSSGLGFKELLFRLLGWVFRAKNRSKWIARAPLRAAAAVFGKRHPHPHIDEAPAGAGPRDRMVWDPLTDQPHQHAGRWERLRVRLADAPVHGATTARALALVPRVRQRARELERGLYAAPLAWGGAGVALRARQGGAAEDAAAIAELGVRHVYLRLHLWRDDQSEALATARELAGRGLELSFGLAQDRDLVQDRGRWRAAVERAADTFLPYGRTFQVGQAINRSKWGVWNFREYNEMAASAEETLRRAAPDAVLLGPAVIDFEPHALLAALALRRPPVRFDGLASLLYVDRRGAPENRQMGYDTVGKIVLQRAIADASERCGERFWITEVNWPLREGPHSPAGRHVAVDEETQADYLARFYLMALGSGLVDRVFWWQLVARGYGLIDRGDDGALRRRPAFAALAHLSRRLEGATFLGPAGAREPARLYRFRDAGGEELVVGWSAAETVGVELERRPAEVTGRDGEGLPRPADEQVALDSSPRYFRF